MSTHRYVELQTTSHFSFLRGASSADELFAQAAVQGIEALAIVDRNSLAGIVRAHEASKATGVRLIVGCRLDLGAGVVVEIAERRASARDRFVAEAVVHRLPVTAEEPLFAPRIVEVTASALPI